MNDNFNVFHLIKAVKGITFQFEYSKYHLKALDEANIRLYTLRQGKYMGNAKYQDIFQMHVAIVEQIGGEITRYPVIRK
jgi:hypothetical protein